MNMHAQRLVLLGGSAVVAFLAVASPSRGEQAGEERVSTAQERRQVSLTVYNDDLSLIRERRTVPVGKGPFHLRFEDVTSGIDPTTVHLTPQDAGSLTLLEQNYEFDLISQATLLEKYVGRRVGYRNEDGSIGDAMLLSTIQGPVYRLDGKIVFELPGPVVLDDVPPELSARPTLQWLLEGRREGQQDVEVAYLSSGLSWRADYVLLLDEAEQKPTSPPG